jgi:putative membrane-bound dehydrogenase-like protein
LVAAEPDVVDPVALAFDEHRRMFVVENRGYPEDDSKKGSIALLTDDDGDGRYTRTATFYEGLAFPNGVMAWQGGIIVTDAPHALFLKDSNGDGHADIRTVLLDGFYLGGSTQLRASHPTLGLDNWIHFTNGLGSGAVFEPIRSEASAVPMGRNDLRYNPRTGELEKAAGMGQFGLAFDDFGHKFICSNRNHIQHALLSPVDLARNPALPLGQTAHDISDHGAAAHVFPISDARTAEFAHAGTFTAACGLVIYRGNALPDEYRGNAFVCEPTGNLIHRDVLQPSGSTFTATRGREGVEFLTSEDDWFSPVFLANGPEGALYVCDMYRGETQHPTYMPGNLGTAIDFYAGKDLGRIYRLVGERSPVSIKADAFASTNSMELVQMLSSANAWEHETAHRLLLEGRDAKALPLLRETLSNSAAAWGAVRALSLISGMDALREDDVLTGLKSDFPPLREHAAILARHFASPSKEMAQTVRMLRRDSIAHVRYAASLAIGDVEDSESVDALVDLLLADAPADPWLRAAVLSGLSGRVAPFLGRYLDSVDSQTLDEDLVNDLGFMIASSTTPEQWGPVTNSALQRGHPDSASWRMQFVVGVLRGAHQSGQLDTRQAPIEVVRGLLSDDGAEYLDCLVDGALFDVWDVDAPNDVRIAAIDLLGYTQFDIGGLVLGGLLDPQTPSNLQLEAVRSLFRIPDDRVYQLMFGGNRWEGFTEPVRTTALAKLLGTRSGTDQLIQALESDDVADWTLPVQYRNRLLRYDDESLQRRARRVIGNKKQAQPMDVFRSLKPILNTASNPATGRAVFERTCASCHTFDDVGHDVGPDLTAIASQPSEWILLTIIDPNSQRHPGYENYFIETDTLESFSGIITAESDASITLRSAYGIENTIPRASIVSMRLTGLSMMPSGLEAAMSSQELRDLIGFLKREMRAAAS